MNDTLASGETSLPSCFSYDQTCSPLTARSKKRKVNKSFPALNISAPSLAKL
eukprot:Pgem_evm1s18492